MSEKISPIGLSFITNRYSGSDLVHKPQYKSTVILDTSVYDFGEIFEKKHFDSNVLYSWENKGRVKGLFEGKNSDNFVSLTKTFDGGIFEKIKKGASTMMARYNCEGRLVELAEITPNKATFIDRTGTLSEKVGAAAKAEIQNFIRGIKVI